MSVTRVLEGIISTPSPASHFPSPVLEVTMVRRMYKSTTLDPQDEFAVLIRLSDNVHWIHAVVVDPDLHQLCYSGKIRPGAIVKLTDYRLRHQPRKGGFLLPGDKPSLAGSVPASPSRRKRSRSPPGSGFGVVRDGVQPIHRGGGTDASIPCLEVLGLEIVRDGGAARPSSQTAVSTNNVSGPTMALSPRRFKSDPAQPEDVVVDPIPSTTTSLVRLAQPSFSSVVTAASADADTDTQASSVTAHSVLYPKAANPWAMKRVMFGDLENTRHDTRADFLAVVVRRRLDARERQKSKQDWYLWDTSSRIINGRRRKTILSVWFNHKDFQPKVGTIVALWGMTVDKKWNDSEAGPTRMVRALGTKGHGNINAYKAKLLGKTWFVLEPRSVEGYAELRRWWETAGREEARLDEKIDVEKKQAEEEEEFLKQVLMEDPDFGNRLDP